MLLSSRTAASVVRTATALRRCCIQNGRSSSTFPAPRLFDYATVTSNLSVTDAIDSVESAFGALAQGKVDVPMPMVRIIIFIII